MKQPLHEPLAVQYQVLILYALTHGFLDTVPVDDILAFESQLFDFFDMNHKDLLETIVTTKDLPAEDLLDAAIQEFKASSAIN